MVPIAAEKWKLAWGSLLPVWHRRTYLTFPILFGIRIKCGSWQRCSNLQILRLLPKECQWQLHLKARTMTYTVHFLTWSEKDLPDQSDGLCPVTRAHSWELTESGSSPSRLSLLHSHTKGRGHIIKFRGAQVNPTCIPSFLVRHIGSYRVWA